MQIIILSVFSTVFDFFLVQSLPFGKTSVVLCFKLIDKKSAAPIRQLECGRPKVAETKMLSRTFFREVKTS